MRRRTLWRTEHLDSYLSDPALDGRVQVTDGSHNLISSLCNDGTHMPAIDLDIPHEYVPSSTEGHGHLFLNVEMDWVQYKKLLTVLYECGLIEYGFYTLSLERRASFLRAPGSGRAQVITGSCGEEIYFSYDDEHVMIQGSLIHTQYNLTASEARLFAAKLESYADAVDRLGFV